MLLFGLWTVHGIANSAIRRILHTSSEVNNSLVAQVTQVTQVKVFGFCRTGVEYNVGHLNGFVYAESRLELKESNGA